MKLRSVQDKTKNGNIVHENDVVNKKLLHRLEHQLQMSKIKLSTSRNDNIHMRNRVQDLRREKLLHLQILNDLLKEASAARRRSKFCQKEVTVTNEKKMKVKMAIAGMKQRMVRDMEEFGTELEKAKASISATQAAILMTIRDKLQSTSEMAAADGSLAMMDGRQSPSPTNGRGFRTASYSYPHPGTAGGGMGTLGSAKGTAREREKERLIGHTALEAEAALRETDFKTIEELLTSLQSSEENVFALYHETQSRHQEVEAMELENKHLEQAVQQQMRRLHELEGNQEVVKEELEKNIQNLKSSISKYDENYSKNMEVLKAITPSLVNLLQIVASDDAAVDQQLLSAGLNDRNVDQFLSLFEQRIDELIQMSKAANHQSIRREDFIKVSHLDRGTTFQTPVPPAISDAADDDEDYDETAGKLQPLNIPMLKEIIHKKVQRSIVSTQIRRLDKSQLQQLGGNGGNSMRSRQTSNASLHSQTSNKSLG